MKTKEAASDASRAAPGGNRAAQNAMAAARAEAVGALPRAGRGSARGWVAAALVAACIVPRRYPDAASEELCERYCDAVESACTMEAVYTSREVCLGTCRQLRAGRAGEEVGLNTVECRLRNANAVNERDEDRDELCRAAGPGGEGGEFSCGGRCTAFCQLRGDLCGAYDRESSLDREVYQSPEDCAERCAKLLDSDDPNASRQRADDSLQCRVQRLTAVALASDDDLASACRQTKISPYPEAYQEGFACAEEPSCATMCALAQRACTGEFEVYRSEEECLRVCELFPTGATTDRGAPQEPPNTTGCRIYHAYNAIVESNGAANHCAHVGPTGDGHCNTADNCNGYCVVLQSGCARQFEAEFGAGDVGLRTCEERCQDVPQSEGDAFSAEEGRYSSANPVDGDNLRCRTFHAVRALSDPDDACENALGGGVCSGS